MLKRTFVVILAAIVLTASAVLSLAAIPGAPRNSALVFSVSMPAEGREPLNKLIETIIKSDFFSKAVEKFKADFGTEFPRSIIDRILKISCVSIIFTIDPKNVADYLVFGIFLTLDTAADAEEVLKSAGTVLEPQKGVMKLKETDFKEIRTFTPDTAENQIRVISSGKTAGIAFTMATEEAAINESFKPILRSFVSEAENVSSLEKFKKAFISDPKIFNAFIYFNDDFIDSLSQSKKNEDIKEYVDSGFFSFSLTPDLSKATFNSSLFFKEPKDTVAAELFKLINVITSNPKGEGVAASSLPADILGFMDVKLNLGDEFWALPLASKYKKTPFMNMMNLNDDVLSWFDGSIFIAIGEYSLNFVALKEMKFQTPEIYIGLGSHNEEKAFKFLDKTRLLISNFTSIDMKIKDETLENKIVTVYEVPEAPLKNLEICAATFGNQVIITSDRQAFQKFAGAKTKKETSLAAGDYSEVADYFNNSFFSIYSRASKIVDILNMIALIKPEFSAAKDFTFLKQSAFSVGFKNGELSISSVFSIDIKKFSFENIMKQLETLKSSAGK